MKPTTKQEREVVELSAKLAPPTAADMRYFAEAGTRHLALYSGKRVKCVDCGHEWKQEGLKKQVRCPHCGRLLMVAQTKARKKSEVVYDIIVQSCRGWQVVRYFRVKWSCPVKGGRELDIHEVVQHWISSDGKLYIIARKRSMGMYIDQFVLDEPMSLKKFTDCRAYHLSYWGVIVKGITSKLKRNGFNGGLFGMHPYDLFSLLLTNPFAETLFKAGHYNLLRQLNYRNRLENADFLAAAKIVVRNRYMLTREDATLWADMIDSLRELGKDIHNKIYVCPQDLKAAHDKYMNQVHRKRERQRERERAERQRAEAERVRKDKKLANTYVKRMKKYFGMVITNGHVVICALKNIAEFEAEGAAMHHCVFENRYYAKENSLVLSAKVNGERQETVEVDLKRFEVVQSRGVRNSNSKYHNEIVSLVNANMPMIKKICVAKKPTKNRKKIGICP